MIRCRSNRAQVFALVGSTQRAANRQYWALAALQDTNPDVPGIQPYAPPSQNPFDRLTDYEFPDFGVMSIITGDSSQYGEAMSSEGSYGYFADSPVPPAPPSSAGTEADSARTSCRARMVSMGKRAWRSTSSACLAATSEAMARTWLNRSLLMIVCCIPS